MTDHLAIYHAGHSAASAVAALIQEMPIEMAIEIAAAIFAPIIIAAHCPACAAHYMRTLEATINGKVFEISEALDQQREAEAEAAAQAAKGVATATDGKLDPTPAPEGAKLN
jgi:hypothetical protein